MDTGEVYPHNQNAGSGNGDPGGLPGSSVGEKPRPTLQALEYLLTGTGADLSLAARMVYVVLAYHVNDESKCWPSYAKMMQESGLSRRSVINAINELEGKGWIKRTRRKRPSDGRNASSLYTLLDRQTGKPLIVHDVHHNGAVGAPSLMHDMHPNRSVRADMLTDNMKHEVVVSAPASPSQKTTIRPQDTPDGIALKQRVASWASRFDNMQKTPEEYAEDIGRFIDLFGVDAVYDEITKHLEEGWDYDGRHNGNCHPGTLIRALRALTLVSA